MYKAEYPHLLTEERSPVWSEESLEDYPQTDEWKSDEWKAQYVRGHIPEVPHTYAVIEGLFGIMNEKQVAIGESTCGARYAGLPQRECPTCEGPLVDVTALSVVALERCDTARCAVEMIGSMSEQFGYYTAEAGNNAEAGEALTIADGEEAWMFHILPDPTFTTAIWVAQRLEPDHISVSANAFVIRDVDPNSPNFIYSTNLFEIAESEDLWDSKSGKALDFTVVYGPPTDDGKSAYSTRRVWRVLSLAAPSLKLNP